MSKCVMSGVLFAKDARSLTGFYAGVLAGTVLREDPQFALLDWGGFHLVIHQVPAHLASEVLVSTPPQRREQGALRLDYPVDDVTRARDAARRMGGAIDDAPPSWAGNDASFFLGYDPEGNVFGAKTGER
jgi:hypothetical protein